MLFPYIRRRIEQGHKLTGNVIDSADVRTLVGIAEIAGQREVRKFGQPAILPRDDVLDVESGGVERFGKPAILAAPIRAFAHFALKRSADHVSSCGGMALEDEERFGLHQRQQFAKQYRRLVLATFILAQSALRALVS
jgi:hypothetical protein